MNWDGSDSALAAFIELQRRIFFPAWRPEREWRSGFVGFRDPDVYGHAEPRTGTLCFKKADQPPHPLAVIHVLAHAVSGSRDHDDAWLQAMERAAEQAERSGVAEFAAAIREAARLDHGTAGDDTEDIIDLHTLPGWESEPRGSGRT